MYPENGTARPSEPLTWAALHAAMEDVEGRSDAWREAGLWALGSLETHLGPDWPNSVAEKDPSGAARELRMAPFHTIAYAQLVELALRLELLRRVEGVAKVRRAIARDPRPEQLAHARTQLEVAALSLRSGRLRELEPNPTGIRPSDVAVESQDGTFCVETRAVLTSDDWRADDRWTDALFARIHAIEGAHGVRCEGEINVRLSDEETDELLGLLEDRARLTAIGAIPPPLRLAGTALEVVPRSDRPGSGLRGPQLKGDSWARIGPRIAEKVEKAAESGASWLRIDVLEGLWSFTHWATLPLADKLRVIAPPIRKILGQLDGLVLTSGARLRQGDFENEEVPGSDGLVAIRRCFDPLRVRETLIVSAEGIPDAGLGFWRELYEAEPSWLDWGLGEAGLRPCSEVFAF